MSILSSILEIGATFDWITPLHAFGMDLYYALFRGGSHTFLVSCECGWSGHGIIKLLHNFKIETWGHMIVNDTIMVTVPKARAAIAENVLDQAGLTPWILSTPAPRARHNQTKTATIAENALQLQCLYCGNVLPATTIQCPGCGSRQLAPFFPTPIRVAPPATREAPSNKTSRWDRFEDAGDRFFKGLSELGL